MTTEHKTSRRSVLAALAAIPALAVVAPAMAQASGDGELLEAWAAYQRAARIIASRGTFFSCEDHSPAEAEIADHAENVIGRATATTPEGLLAKAWCALWTAGDGFSDPRLRWNDMARGLDFDGLERELPGMDWEYHAPFTLIRSLRLLSGEA